MREEEGENLQKDLAHRIDTIENYATEIESRHPEVTKEYQNRLKEKIKSLNDCLLYTSPSPRDRG